jgi:acetyl/propionyl-CoA carboxylase alpha subunit
MGGTRGIRTLGPPMKLKLNADSREFDVEIIARDGASVRGRIGSEEIAAEIEPTANGTIIRIGERRLRILTARNRNSILVAVGPAQYEFIPLEERAARGARGLATPEVTAPMPGKVLKLLVVEGQTVEAAQALIVLEAMKMETTLYAESAATVKKIRAKVGDMVDHGVALLELTAAADPSGNKSPARDG